MFVSYKKCAYFCGIINTMTFIEISDQKNGKTRKARKSGRRGGAVSRMGLTVAKR